MRAIVPLLVLLPGLVFAQDPPKPSEVKPTEKSLRAEAIFIKLRQVDLLTQIMPLVLQKRQIDLLLVALEKARKDQQIILDADAGQMISLEKESDAALADVEARGAYPPREIRGRIFAVTARLSMFRQAARDGIVLRTDEAVLKILNAGQIKAMVGTFAPEEINAAKPDSVTDEQRRRAYVANILLDPLAYDLLRKLYKKAG